MSDTNAYQLHICLRHISPMIWRRLLLRSDSSLQELHHIIQIAFNWSDDRLHGFHIHGKDFGESRANGISYYDDPSTVKLACFAFRKNECFRYVYNFFDHWEHMIRVERFISSHSKGYPICIAGRGKSPPEGCGGVAAFAQLKNTYSKSYVSCRTYEILSCLLKGEEIERDDESGERYEFGDFRREAIKLRYWANLERINRREINRKLKRYASGEKFWELIDCIENREELV